MNIAIYGGAFDPVTLAHEAIARIVEGCSFVDQLWIVPCMDHPFGKQMASFNDRVSMCKSRFGFPMMETRYSRTIDLIDKFKCIFPGNEYLVVIGSDEAGQIHKWHRWEELVEKYKFIVIERRPECSLTPVEIKYWSKFHHYLTPDPAVPSTASSSVRKIFNEWWTKEGVQDGQNQGYDKFADQISRPIFDLVVAKGLYKPSTP